MDILTPVVTVGSAFAGGVSSGVQWKSPDNKISFRMITVAISTAIVLAELISGICDIWGVNIKIQCGLCGAAGYLGPELIIKPLSLWILKKYGVSL